MNGASRAALIAGIHDSRRDGTAAVELGDGPSHDEALTLQLEVLSAFEAEGDRLAGWKVSFTSGRSRDRMGAGYRPFGYVLESHVFPSGARIELPAAGVFAIEPELCLTVGERLRGRVTRDQVRRAVASVHPAFELNNIRSTPQSSDATVIADGMGQWGVVLGPPRPPHELSIGLVSVSLERDDREAASTPAPHLIDDPFLSLARLAELLGEHGRALEEGQRVITGSFSRAEIPGSGRWRARFSGLGEVEAEFSTR